MKSVYVVWQDIQDRMWHPVARLTVMDDGGFKLNYTNGAKHPNFVPFPRMNDMSQTYYSNDLFPFFKNRIISERRPEFYDMLKWTNIDISEYNPLELLSVSGGVRKTDNFRIVSIPENVDGYYKIKFFVSSIRYISDKNKAYLEFLKEGDELIFSFEDENPSDQDAVRLIDSTREYHIGYYPRYLCRDFRKLVSFNINSKDSHIKVLRNNNKAPEQYRLLCEFSTRWPDGFIPFMSLEYFDYK
ncbi:HIRAN domain-containing protein [Phytobacter ursingii]|uniref:HIRAN domain-containing protein n=1 Tax=Phytobacter ursingii TaxID=1972431 RepID=UPI0031B7B531